MSGWTRTEDDWLEEFLAVAPRPWTEKQVYTYLRYVDRRVRRGVGYWTPDDAPDWLAADGQRSRPLGRRGLQVVAGAKDWQARAWMEAVGAWFDPEPATEAEKAIVLAGGVLGPARNVARSTRGAPVAHPSGTRDVPVPTENAGVVPTPDHPSSTRGAPVAHPSASRSRENHPRASTQNPAPEPQGGSRAHARPPDPPTPPEAPRTTDGRPLPADLADLLGDAGLTPQALALARQGVTPEVLLAMTEHELAHTGGVAGSWRVIANACQRAGFPLGCVAPVATGPPRDAAGPSPPADGLDEFARLDARDIALGIRRPPSTPATRS